MSFIRRHAGAVALLSLAAILFTPTLSIPAAWSLKSGVKLGAGGSLSDITTADFDNDNVPDIIGVNHKDNGTISFIGGNPDGQFDRRRVSSLTNDPIAVESADFDRDGNTDLVIANWDDSTISVLMGRGDSTFDNPVFYGTGAKPVDVEVADLDGDGMLDIAVANLGGGTVSVFIGGGDGTFSAGVEHPAGAVVRSLAVADFDGDMLPDIACTNWEAGTVHILLNLGGGVFADNGMPVAAGNKPWTVEAADFDLDGNADMAVSNTANDTVYVFLGNGDGTFGEFSTETPGAFKFATPAGPSAVRAAFLNNDRYPDLVIANALANSFTVYLGDGDGGFGSLGAFAANAYPASVSIGDFNGDLLNDVAVGAFNSGTVMVNKADLTLEGRWAFKPYTTTPAPSYPAGLSPVYLRTGGFNGDTFPDIVAAGSGGAANLLPGMGDGALGAPSAYTASKIHLPACSPVAVDINGDVMLDEASVVFGSMSTAGSVSVRLRQADGSLGDAVEYPVGVGPTCIHAADLNKDGYPDLVVTNSIGVVPAGGTDPVYTVSVLMNNLDGTLRPAVGYEFAGEPVNVTTGDMNGDGYPDLVVPALVSGGPDTVSVLTSQRGTGFGAAVSYEVGESPGGVLVFDVNRDDKMDIAVPNTADDTVTVLLSNTTNLLQPQAPLLVGAAPVFAAACDLDMNGLPDLAVANSGDGTVSMILSEEKSTLTVDVNDPAMGSVDIKIGVDPASDGEHDTGTEFTLTPMPASGHAFTGWSGGVRSKNNPLALRLGGDRALTANFAVGPYITGITPGDGIMGDTITVTGNTFGSSGSVKLGGRTVKGAVWSDTGITFTVPPRIPYGDTMVRITSRDTRNSATAGFTIRRAVVGGLSASSGARGSTLTISGTDFGTGRLRVYFYPKAGGRNRGAKVVATTSGPDTATVMVPRLSPGDYDVVVRNSHGDSTVVDAADNDFTVTAP